MHLRSFIIAAIFCLSVGIQQARPQEIPRPFLEFTDHPWVDSVFKSLTPEERIGQLIWIEAGAENDIRQTIKLSDIVRKKTAGGIIFPHSEPQKLAEMVNYFQSVSQIPLFIIQKSDRKPLPDPNGAVSYPSWIALDAIHNDDLIRKMGKTIADQLKRTGVHILLNRAGNPSGNELIHRGSLLENGIISVEREFPLSFQAGSYIPVSSGSPESAVREISQKVKKGIISQKDIDAQCRRILSAKYWAGLAHISALETGSLREGLSGPATEALLSDLYSNALTVVRNDRNTIPVTGLDKARAAVVVFNRDSSTVFQQRLQDYLPADLYFVDPSSVSQAEETAEKLSNYNLVIGGIFDRTDSSAIEADSREISMLFGKLSGDTKKIIVCFGSPFLHGRQALFSNADGIVLAYEDNHYTQDLSAQLIFGAIGAKGTLYSAIPSLWPAGSGIITKGNIRIRYAFPENAGLSSRLNDRIDFIARSGLMAGAYPGCEVMIARKGIVVFHKTYGYHTYDHRIPVWKSDLFDLASVTKISSTLGGLMLLDSEGKFSVENSLGDYLPYFRNSNKGKLLMKDLLTHQAGLKDWIPFWKETVRSDSSFRRRTFTCDESDDFPIKVADNLYIHKNYRNKIMNEIRKSPLGPKKYVYSDLTFIISTGIIDRLSGEEWVEYITRNLYHKLGAYDICFNPYLKYPLHRIVPTEYDSLFRRQLLHGTVHDEGAAMLGGISGHAGLFATANDLMKLMEMYRRMGEYGGEQLISKDVMERYTRVQFPENNNRRGLGFDKPLLNNNELSDSEAYPAKDAAPESFGHSGYTGTFVWMDPVNEISYIFFSNRVHPTRNNTKLSEMNIRSQILQAVYDSIIK